MHADRTLLVATEGDATAELAKGLDAELSPLPALETPDAFESWRAEFVQAAPRRAVVIAPWQERDSRTKADLVRLDATEWQRRFELPYLRWNFALGAASKRCADQGAIVALVQAPAALDAAGWTPEFAIADGVLALVRSVAASEGSRGVRANLVTTPLGVVDDDEIVAPAPPLASYPGSLASEVVGALRLVLSPESVGLTGRLLSADGGRSL